MNMAEAPIKATEISKYHKDLASLIKSEPNRAQRRDFLLEERKTPEYQHAKEKATQRLDTLDKSQYQRELNPQQQTILWAQKTIEDYNNLPKGNHSERKRAKRFLEKTAGHLFQNPKSIDTIVSAWKARTEKNGFYDLVKQESAQRTKEKWEEIKPEVLSELVRIYANSSFIKDFAERLLSSYFKGPQSRKQRVDAQYVFGYTLLDLINDSNSLTAAIRISTYGTDIMPRDPYLIGLNVLQNWPYSEEEETIKRSIIVDHITSNMHVIASDPEGLRKIVVENHKFGDNDKNKAAITREIERSARKFGPDKAQEMHDRAIRFMGGGDLIISEEEFRERLAAWPARLLYSEDSLREAFLRLVLDKITAERNKELAKEAFIGAGFTRAFSLSIVSPEGYTVDISFPEELKTKRGEVLKKVFDVAISKEQKDAIMRAHGGTIVKNLGARVSVDGYPVIAIFRRTSGLEANYHATQSLREIGFPAIEIYRDINEENQKLADEIRRTQIRFLNRRGVRIPLTGELKELGYSYIDFHKDSKDSEKTMVSIFVGDIPYSVKLDKYLNFDLEGKRLDAPFLQDKLRYIFLLLLKPILCEERINSHLQEVGSEEKEVVSRMGHLRWLPQGQRFSKSAVENYFRVEGKDLFVTNMQRLEEHKTDKETTYVKPVIEKEENLPPITIHLPGVLQFN